MDIGKLYQLYRPALFGLAYRMLGSVTDAEDIVQDTFLDLCRQEAAGAITNMKSYACKIVANKCSVRLRRLIQERECYIGPWLPEPIVEHAADPSSQYLHRESLATAYILLLQQLSEAERLVFLLKEILRFNYREISYITDKTEAHCRQLCRRARLAVGSGTVKQTVPEEHLQAFVERFVHALQTGDIRQLLEVISDDVVMIGDSGGHVAGTRVPIRSAERVSAFLMKTASLVPEGARTDYVLVNGRQGIVLSDRGAVVYVFSFQMQDGRIAGIYAVGNPDKLAGIPSGGK